MIRYNVNACDQICNELQIHFTKSCPNKCSFCIDATNRGLDNCSREPDVQAIYKRILYYEDKIDSVCISGGEPMLFMMQLFELVMLLKQNMHLGRFVRMMD